MSGIVTIGNRIFVLTVKEDCSVFWKETNIRLPSVDIIASAAGAKGLIYLLDRHNASQILVYNTLTENLSTFMELPHPAKQLLFLRDRLYALSKEGTNIFVIDMYAKVLDTLNHECGKVVTMCPADHGFILLEGKKHCVVAYHFNNGCTPVPSLGERVRVLGALKRRVFVLDAHNQLYTVSECGDVQKVRHRTVWGLPHHRFSDLRTHSFVMVGDVMIEEDDEEKYALRVYSTAEGKSVDENGEKTGTIVLLPRISDKEGSLCVSSFPEEKSSEAEGDVCPLCFCELEEDGSGMTLDCGHSFHQECVEMWVKNWDAFREKAEHIVFTNAMCPSGCKHLLRHVLLPQSKDIASCYTAVRKAKEMMIATQYSSKTEDELLYYICYCCQKPFFGGERICYRMMGCEPFKRPEDLMCPSCEPFTCKLHGKKFPLYKCYYCCNPATDRSFGCRHLCDRCFQKWEKMDIEPEACVKENCPWKGKHSASPASPPHPMGCAACLFDLGIVDPSKVIPAPPKESISDEKS